MATKINNSPIKDKKKAENTTVLRTIPTIVTSNNEMKEYKVIDLYKVQKKEQGQYIKTGTMILTFVACYLPSHVKIGWNRFEVREYISASRCFKCQGFN